jgi:hypothetical protein
MPKKNTTTPLHLLHFPNQKERRVREIKRDLATLYDPISHKRVILLADILQQGLGADHVSVEALLALICAVADPEGDGEKFQTAKTALMQLSLMNNDYNRIDSAYTQQVLQDNGFDDR